MSFTFYIITVFLMLLGNITHIVKQIVHIRQSDGSFSIKKYLSMYPYKTFLIVMAGVGGYLGLLAADELDYVTSFMAGYMANSFGDINAEHAKVEQV